MLKQFHPVYVNTHFNHPAGDYCGISRGLPAHDLRMPAFRSGNQTVLLTGSKRQSAVMKRLMQRLLAIRVRPYYIHQMDLVKGTGHFRTTVAQGIEIMESLRGHTSGLANPHYVIDLPGGKGKVPLLPDCVYGTRGKLLLTNYLGETSGVYGCESKALQFFRGEGNHIVYGLIPEQDHDQSVHPEGDSGRLASSG